MRKEKDFAFGNQIAALRQERNLSQFQLGRLLNVSDKAVSKWENGNAKPRLSTCYRLADILGVTVDQLLSPPGDRQVSLAERAPLPDKEMTSHVRNSEENTLNSRMDSAPRKRAELHMRTSMTRSDGITELCALSDRAAEWGLPAVAVTDFGNTRAFPDTLSRRRRHPQKVIFGCEMIMLPAPDSPVETGTHIMLLARSREGLVNLNRLVSLSFQDYPAGLPCLSRDSILQYRDGLLLGSSCEGGEISVCVRAGQNPEEVRSRAAFYDYLEVQPVDNELGFGEADSREELEEQIRKTVQLGRETGKPVVAVSNGRYLDPEDGLSRAVLQYMDGLENAETQPPYFLRTTEEMLSAFSFLGTEEAEHVVIDASLELAGLVEDSITLFPTVKPRALMPHLPQAEEHMKKLAMDRACAVYGNPLPERVAARLEKEFRFISLQDGWTILEASWLAVQRSLQEGYPVGVRGSVGASLTAFLTGICRVNPLPPHYVCPECRYTLFETPARGSCGADLPRKKCPYCGHEMHRDGFFIPVESFLDIDGTRQIDIDLNLAPEVQGSVQGYIRDLFGAAHVFRPGNNLGLSEQVAAQSTSLYAADHRMSMDADRASQVSGQIAYAFRTSGQHPGGLIILPEEYEVCDFTPVRPSPDDQAADLPVSLYDMFIILPGLVKMDLLGNDMPPLLHALHEMTGIDLNDIPLNDPGVLSLFRSPNALHIREEDLLAPTGCNGILYFDGSRTQDMLHRFQPSTVEELVRILGLVHGTGNWQDNGDELIQNGIADIFDLPTAREDIIRFLQGHGVDFDHAFRISEYVRRGRAASSGFTPEMDEIMHQARIPQWYMDTLKKILYLFPRAHAAAYAADCIRLAWYKLHYPEAFYTACLRSRSDSMEISDFTLDTIHLRRSILSLRMELAQSPEDPYSETVLQQKSRLRTLRLLLEMKLRGCSLSPESVFV